MTERNEGFGRKNTSMNTTINLLKSTVEQFPTKEAIYDGTRRMTYEELDKESNAIASQLKRSVFKKETMWLFPPKLA